MGLCTFDAEGDAVEDENGACYEGGFGGSVTVVAQAPEEIPLIWVSFPSSGATDQSPLPTPPPQLTESSRVTVQPANNEPSKRAFACSADALITFGVLAAMPEVGILKGAAGLAFGGPDVGFNPVQFVMGYKSLFSVDPTLPSAATAYSAGYSAYKGAVYDAVGGDARVARLEELVNRTHSGADNAAKYGGELQSLKALGRSATLWSRIASGLNYLSLANDVYNCWSGF